MQSQLKELVTHYQKALLIKHDNLAVYEKIAELYYQQRELEKVLEILRKALQVEPNFLSVSQVFNKTLQTLGFQGEENIKFQNFLQKNLSYESFYMLVLGCEHVTNIADAKTWKDAVALGCSFKEKQQLDEAVSAFIKAIEIEPSLSLPYLILGYIINYHFSFSANQLEKIITRYHQVISGRLTSHYADVVLGDMLTKQGKVSEAITAYKNGIERKIDLDTKITAQYINSPKNYDVSFLIIGMGKAGTSSLFHYLCQHPQIIPPTKKELHFFNINFDLGIDWYLAQFPPLPTQGGFLTGEATPWYLGGYEIEKKVSQLFPKIKLIAILRNPVTRAISNYYMTFKMMKEHRSLEVAMNSEIEILTGITDTDDIIEKYWQTEKGYLWFGLYFYFFKKWMAVFPREQFLILRSEDLYNQTDKTMQQVYDFLEIDNYSLPIYPKINSGSYEKNNNELHQKLSNFFQPHNRKLEDYLGMKFDWE